MDQKKFKKEIWEYYRKNKRDFSWRRTTDPYRIVVSEIMLQQTQTHRVEPKYKSFIKLFPNFKRLATASIPEVLAAWQGLGYNRRALYLKKIAQAVMGEHGGKLPADPRELHKFPGIGPNTAGSIAAFAFNRPAIFIETNIRRVFIHFFFADKDNVDDNEIILLIKETVDEKEPREWYFALMDYGARLAKEVVNPNRRSRHYLIQKKFFGSDRETRGIILRLLLQGPARETILIKETGKRVAVVKKILNALSQEGFIEKNNLVWRLVS